MNNKIIKPKPINMSLDITGNLKKSSTDIEILSLNKQVRKILDYPIN